MSIVCIATKPLTRKKFSMCSDCFLPSFDYHQIHDIELNRLSVQFGDILIPNPPSPLSQFMNALSLKLIAFPLLFVSFIELPPVQRIDLEI